jgi:hypothetical protein
MEDDPWYSTVSPDGTRLYVCTDDDGVHRVGVLDIDPASPTYHTVIDSFDYAGTATSPGSGGIAATSRFIYLASNDLTYIDLTTRLVDSWETPPTKTRVSWSFRCPARPGSVARIWP